MTSDDTGPTVSGGSGAGIGTTSSTTGSTPGAASGSGLGTTTTDSGLSGTGYSAGPGIPTGTGMPGSGTQDGSQSRTEDAKQAAGQVAGTAGQQTRKVADTATGEAQKVAGEATTQLRGLLGQATGEVEEQTRTQRDRAADTLRTLGNDLDQMAERSEGGLAADLANELGTRARSFSSYLENREPSDLLDDVRDLARRRTGTFLFGALAAGVVTGRLVRGARDASSSSSDAGADTGRTYTGAAPDVRRPEASSTMAMGGPVDPIAPATGVAVDPIGTTGTTGGTLP